MVINLLLMFIIEFLIFFYYVYILQGMLRTRLAIQETFMNKKDLYQPYIKVIDDRWDKHLRRNLQAAAYFLNPAFLYADNFVDTTEATTSLLDLLDTESICSDSVQAMKELRIYRERQGSFARRSALTAAKTLQPGNFYTYITN